MYKHIRGYESINKQNDINHKNNLCVDHKNRQFTN